MCSSQICKNSVVYKYRNWLISQLVKTEIEQSFQYSDLLWGIDYECGKAKCFRSLGNWSISYQLLA